MTDVTNIIIAGLGGQGVLKASDILAEAAFHTGFDVKKSEVHGVSQRGGSVASDVRFGARVFSPIVPPGEADYLVALAVDQVEPNLWRLRPGGVLIDPGMISQDMLRNKKSLAVALLGVLSTCLEIPETAWLGAIRSQFAEKLYEANLQAFHTGRWCIGHRRLHV